MSKQLVAALLVLALAPAAVAQAPCGGCPNPNGAGSPGGLAPGYVPVGGFAQPMAPSLTGTPYLPDPAALDRLNLRIDWVGAIPVNGQRDAIATVQVADTTQIFVQTRAGLLTALDAVTGAKQWAFRMQSDYVNVYPVGFNDDFVFAVNVARLYAINRLTGSVAFDYELPGVATAGPAADADQIYAVTSGNRLTGYRFPQALRLTAAERQAGEPIGSAARSAAEVIADRYAGPGSGPRLDPTFEVSPLRTTAFGDVGASPNQLTPSVTALPTVTPPYTMSNRGVFATPSLTVLANTQQPYQYRPDFSRFNQQTPSVSVLPPSVYRAAQLANFAPRGPEPTVAWTRLTTSRIAGSPVLTDRDPEPSTRSVPKIRRVWVASDGPGVQAFDRRNGETVIDTTIEDAPVAPLTGPAALATDKVLGIASLLDGNVLALDLLRGGELGARVEWRTPVGGLLNRKPVATREAVYAHGSQSGVARIDIKTGELSWKTADSADRYLAANAEFVYVRDNNGDLLVYDQKATPPSRRLEPLARLPLAGYRVPVTNEVTDRILLASETGLLISLRDASARYALPTRLVPPVPKEAAKAAEVPPEPKKEPVEKKGDGI